MDPIYSIESLRAGDTWTWDETPPDDYPNTTHTVKYELQGPERITIAGAITSASINRFTVAAATSKTYHPGIYRWVRYASLTTDSSTRFTLNSGLIEILADLATSAAGYDARTHNQRTVDLIKAAIEALATQGVVELSVGGRSYRKEDLPTLFNMLNLYERRVANEIANQKVANGGKSGKKILYQFTTTS